MKRTFDYKIVPWILSIPVSVWFICQEIVNFPPDNWYHWVWGGPVLVAGAILIAWVGFGLIGGLIVCLIAVVTLFVGWFASDEKRKTNNSGLREKFIDKCMLQEIPLRVVLIILVIALFASAVTGYIIIKRGMDPAIPYQAGMDNLSLDKDSALAYFHEAVELNPQYAEAWFRVGQCNWGLGNYHDAVEAYRRAIQIKPNYALAHGHLGGLYAALGRFAKASEVLSEALRLDPENAGNYACLGECYFQLGHYGRAIELFAQAIRTHSGIAEIMMNPTYINIGINDEALWYSCVGTAYCEVGRYDLAIKACNQSVSKNPDLPDAHLALGLAYLKQGDKNSALREYDALKTLDKETADELLTLIQEQEE
jgi:tetratricopeptide (TPR) repeat protein